MLRIVSITCLIIASLVFRPEIAGADSCTYTYDLAGRLTHFVYYNQTSVTYKYDAADNRVQQSVGCSPAAC